MNTLNHILLHRSKETIRAFSSLRALCCQDVINLGTLPKTILQSIISEDRRQLRHFSLDSNNSIKVLSESTMIVQDGINIEELPLLIRRATRNSFPFVTYSYGGEKICQETEFDNTFRQVLQSCCSVNDVFRLLEVPSDKVRGYSAAFALERLHVLKHLNTDWNSIHSFIRSAVMRELYDTVEKDIGQLSNSTLISLVDCYIAAEGFSPSCLSAINTEVQIRIGESLLSIEELLMLAYILKSGTERVVKNIQPNRSSGIPSMSIVSENASRFLSNDDQIVAPAEHFDKYCAKDGPQVREEIRANCEELVNNVWLHLFSRYKEINADTLPATLQALPVSQKSMVALLEKPLNEVWVNLSPEGIVICLKNLIRLRVNNASMMTNLSRWSYVNIHKMTPTIMLTMLNTYLQYGFFDENFIHVIEKCLQLKGLKVQTNVIAMCVEYCSSNKYLSPVVMDVAAKHFTLYGYSYEPLQLYAVLKSFGHLNYLPSHPEAFLKMVESCVWDRFDHLDVTHLLKILTSFTFVNIFPKNFSQRLSSNEFFAKIQNLKPSDRMVAVSWLKGLKHALIMDTNIDPQKCIKWLVQNKSRSSTLLYCDHFKGSVRIIKAVLNKLIGRKFCTVLPFYGCHTINLDSHGAPVELIVGPAGELQSEVPIDKKLAIVLRSSEHFITNTKQLLGTQAQRMAHLKKLEYIPIEIRLSELLYAERISEADLMNMVKQHLQPWVNFNLVLIPELCQDLPHQQQQLKQSLSEWLGYDDLPEKETVDLGDFDIIDVLLKSKDTVDQSPHPDHPSKPSL